MAPGWQPAPGGTAYHSAPARRAVPDARRVVLFASGLQRSDAPTAAMAAEAINATVRAIGVRGCASRMAQEFGDHPDAAAERMRWICQLAEVLAWPQPPAGAGRASSRASNEIEARTDHRAAVAGAQPRRHHSARRREAP